jgi:exopolyphosphatase/guanosine-5'-triphosphate,3'-diphosphate pyrophosphatase
MHGLPASARRVLEAAAMLHDLGHAVSPNGHHKHSYYLISNADLPGFGERERQLVALVARYHRRSAPDRHRVDLEQLSASEFRTVRRLATLLRIADALDRSHRQPVRDIDLRVNSRTAALRLTVGAPVDLELWDAGREARLFRQVFGRRLDIAGRRAHHARAGGAP